MTLAIENANDAVIIYEYDPGPMPFRIAWVNPMFERQTGYGSEEAVGRYPNLMFGPKTDIAAVERYSQTLLQKLPALSVLLKYRKDGSTFWSESNMRPLCDDDGNLLGVVAIQRDITERVRAQRRLEVLSSAIDQASDAMAIFEWNESGEWRLGYVNQMFLTLTRYRADEIIGCSSDFLIGPLTDMHLLNGFRSALLHGETIRGEIAFYRADGTPFWAELNGRPFQDPKGEVVTTIIVYRDVTEQHERERQLSYEAAHDDLTGANNRRSFLEALDAALDDVRSRGMTHGLLYVDLDSFKPINDEYGHEAGDRMLVELAANISTKLRRGDLLGRLGGDEFGVLLRGCPREEIERIAGTLLETIRSMTLLWSGHSLRVGASIGVICLDETIEDSAHALRLADEACYDAKRTGRNRLKSLLG